MIVYLVASFFLQSSIASAGVFPAGDHISACTMIENTKEEVKLKGTSNNLYYAYKSENPCRIQVSAAPAQCMGFDRGFEAGPRNHPCFQIKGKSDSTFKAYDGKWEGIKLKPNHEYVLEIEAQNAYLRDTGYDECIDGCFPSEVYNKITVKKVVKDIKK